MIFTTTTTTSTDVVDFSLFIKEHVVLFICLYLQLMLWNFRKMCVKIAIKKIPLNDTRQIYLELLSKKCSINIKVRLMNNRINLFLWTVHHIRCNNNNMEVIMYYYMQINISL